MSKCIVRTTGTFAVCALLAACSGGSQSTTVTPAVGPVGTTARVQTRTVRYKLVDLGTLGGPTSAVPEAFLQINGTTSVPTITARGSVIAVADRAAVDPLCFFDDCFFPGGIVYTNGNVTPLPALPNSSWSSPGAISDSGLVAGISENGTSDPLTGLPEFRAVIWHAGAVTDLGTLDGNNSAAFAVNDVGDAAGYITNTTSDPFLGYQQKAALFAHGKVQALPTLGGPDAIGLLINQRDQIAGVSLTSSTVSPTNPCLQGNPPLQPFLWDNGKLLSIGGFGGTCGMVNAMNSRGEVVGQSYQSGDTIARAFLWRSGQLRDLGTLGGSNASAESINETGEVVGYADLAGAGCGGLSCVHHGFLLKNGVMTDLSPVNGLPCSRALSANAKGQVVGGSAVTCGGNFGAATLWQNGHAIDLNTEIAAGAGMTLTVAQAINDSGIVAGNGVLPDGDIHAFVLVPCTANCAEIRLAQTSLLHYSNALTERALEMQRHNVFLWNRGGVLRGPRD